MAICPRCGAENGTYLSVCSACTQTENIIKGQQDALRRLLENQQRQNSIIPPAGYNDDVFDGCREHTPPPTRLQLFISNVVTTILVCSALFGWVVIMAYTFGLQLSFITKFFK